jgi:hypothetical protein
MARPSIPPENRAFRVCVTFRPDQRAAVMDLQKRRMLSCVLQNAIDKYFDAIDRCLKSEGI